MRRLEEEKPRRCHEIAAEAWERLTNGRDETGLGSDERLVRRRGRVQKESVLGVQTKPKAMSIHAQLVQHHSSTSITDNSRQMSSESNTTLINSTFQLSLQLKAWASVKKKNIIIFFATGIVS